MAGTSMRLQVEELTVEEWSMLRGLISKAFDIDRMLNPHQAHSDVMRSLNTKVTMAGRNYS